MQHDIVAIYKSVDTGDSMNAYEIGEVLIAADEGKVISPDRFSRYDLEEAVIWLDKLKLQKGETQMERQYLLSVLSASLENFPHNEEDFE